jgi:hypothetical protein
VTGSGGLSNNSVKPAASATANTAAIAPPASAALTIAINIPCGGATATKYQANALTAQDVTTTSEIIASARRPDTFISRAPR